MIHRSPFATPLFSAAILGAAWIAPTDASTLRHDVDPEVYVDYGDGFHLVGGVTNGLTSFGSGVVIGRQWVLTAAHVVADPDMVFGISFETDPDPTEVLPPPPWDFPLTGFFRVTEVYLHEYYDNVIGPAGGFDIALLRLDREIPQYTPWDRYRGSSEIGSKGTAVGFGATGTGLTGYDLETGGFLRLAVDNMIDGLASDPRVIHEFVSRDVVDPVTGKTIHFTQQQIAEQFMLSDFDAPPGTGAFANPLGSPDPLPLEGSVAPGDSGGPLIIDGKVGGLNSWILGLPAPYGDGTDDATYGDIAGYLRVSLFNDWIDGVTGIPEPTTSGVFLVVLSAAAMRRRREKFAGADL